MSNTNMPKAESVKSKIATGRTDAEKVHLASVLSNAICSTLNIDDATVSVAIQDVSPAEWVETVYAPHIAAKPEEIFKVPGYNPLSGASSTEP